MKTSRILRPLLALCVCALLSACAGSAADTDFRSKVSSVDVSGNGGASADGAVTAGADAKFTFRDPNAVAAAPTPTPAATPAKPAVK